MDYDDALNILDNWEYRELPDGERIILAIDKAKQSLRECIEREHETIFVLTREDVIECARELGMPGEVITDDVLYQVRKGVDSGLECWSEVVKEAINYALKN
jgi:hypothetical protein